MATSNTGGAFGFLRKSIGGVVYSVSTASIKGIKKQVARQKPTSVRNPKTISQIVQRMKVVPAQLFYQAFEKAAGSVENNPLSHSFQGIAYGNKNKLRFMQLAMQGDPKAYVPKGINFPVPGVYQVSEGSLPSLAPKKITVTGQAQNVFLSSSEPLTTIQVSALGQLGIEVGDQITFLGITDEGNKYKAVFDRLIVGVGNTFTNPESEDIGWEIDDNGNMIDQTAKLACGCFIVSRGTSSASAKRSTAFMMMADSYANLMSPEAYDAAVDSYITGTTYNSLNSDWYLNQGSSQAFNGEVFMQVLNLAAGEGVAAVNAEFVLGRQSNGGSIVYTIFTSDGTSAGTAYTFAANQISTDVAFTAARVAAALGNVNIRYQQYTEAIGQQALGNA